MNEPVKLVTKPTAAAETQESVMRTLRRATEEAEAGDVLEIVIIEKHLDGTWTHLASQTLAIREHIGALELIKLELGIQHLAPLEK